MKEKQEELLSGDLVEDYAEIGVDKLIEETKQFVPMLDELSAEIPYVKTIVAAVKFPRTLSDFLLGKKVSAFLYTSGLDEKKLKKFKKKFNRAKQERLWERVVFSINAHDDKKKSEIIGKLFSALVDDVLNEDEFFDMVHATNSLNLNNLELLKRLYMLTDASIPASLYYSFATLRLIDINNSSVGTWDSRGGGIVYPLNQTGWRYVGIVYDHPLSNLPGVRIGVDDLISELDKDGKATHKAFPLGVLEDKGSRHQEVDLFIVNATGDVLCSADDQLPHAIASAVVKAGETPQLVAEVIAKSLDIESKDRMRLLILRNMEEAPVQKFAFILKSDAPQEGMITDTITNLQTRITGLFVHTDQSRYLIRVLEELEKIVPKDL